MQDFAFERTQIFETVWFGLVFVAMRHFILLLNNNLQRLKVEADFDEFLHFLLFSMH